MREPSRFAGGDQAYLRDVQYADPTRLAARANLHRRYSTAPVRWFPWLVQQITWPADADVLEVGCGPGWLWAEAADLLPASLRLLLTDLSPGMVETALGRVRALDRFASVDGREADVQDLPFDDGTFGVVVANHMLYHAPDPAAAVGELARVKRPHGVALAATSGPRHLVELVEIRRSIFGDGPDVSDTAEAFGSESGRTILEAAFDHVELRRYDDELRCTDVDDVVAFQTSFPPGDEASAHDLRRLTEAVDERCAAERGVFTVHKDVVLFICR